MIKQISMRNSKTLIGTFKANIYKKLQNKKLGDKMYMEYVMNAIREAEEEIANGGKTYTLEEYCERMKQLYGAKV